MKQMLFVCSGNTCRSPMAEAYTGLLAVLNGLPLTASSAGLAPEEGAALSPQAKDCLAAFSGLNTFAARHRAKRLTREQLRQADLCVCMNAGAKALLCQAAPDEKEKIVAFDPPIADPYGGTKAAYEACLAQMAAQLPALLSAVLGAKQEEFIRPATERDLIQLTEIEQQCFSVPWPEAALREALSAPDTKGALLLCRGEQALGSALISVLPPEGELLSLAVLPEERRRGYGERLLLAAERLAALLGGEKIFLEVRAANKGAQALYEKAGYQVIGRRRNYYDAPKEDAILMVREQNGKE